MKRTLFLLLACLLALAGGLLGQWNPNGNSVCQYNGVQYAPKIIPDGYGGHIVIWLDSRAGSYYDIYAQRLDAAGQPMWAQDGVPVIAIDSVIAIPSLCPDGTGGAIVTWSDNRNNTDWGYGIYAQRIDSVGSIRWGASGHLISNLQNDQKYPAIFSDGAGGAIITWQDNRIINNGDIYAQRVNHSGTDLWTYNGVVLNSQGGNQTNPAICTDAAGGAIIAWRDEYSSVNNILNFGKNKIHQGLSP